LLEVVVATGLIAMLIGMVFAIARSSLALGNRVVETQNEEMLTQAFFELLGRRFSELPGNARLDLQFQKSSSQYLSELTLQNVPVTFTWGGQPRVAKAVQIATVRRRSGFLSIVLRYFEMEILEDPTTGERPQTAIEPFAEIELLSDVAYFEWRVLDGRTMEWLESWDLQGRLPLQLELVMAQGAKGEELRHIFWIAPKQNPEVALRQTMQQNQNQPGGTQPPIQVTPGQPGGGRGGVAPGQPGGGRSRVAPGQTGGGRGGSFPGQPGGRPGGSGQPPPIRIGPGPSPR
jgi:hypothetical protein